MHNRESLVWICIEWRPIVMCTVNFLEFLFRDIGPLNLMINLLQEFKTTQIFDPYKTSQHKEGRIDENDQPKADRSG